MLKYKYFNLEGNKIKSKEGYFNYKEYQIYYLIRGFDKKKRSAVLLIHGKGSHSYYINRVAGEKLLAGHTVFSLDLPGWGKSSGVRGHISSFKEYFDILQGFINKFINEKDYDSLFLIGESMGSILAFYIAFRFNLKNLKGIIFCPGIFYVKDFHNPLKLLFINTGSLIAPSFLIKTGKLKNAEKYSDDPEMINYLNADPLWIKDTSFRLTSQINKYLKFMNRNIEKLKYPLLVFQGLKDHYNDSTKVKRLFKKISKNPMNKIVIFENCKHWIAINKEINYIQDEITKWIG